MRSLVALLAAAVVSSGMAVAAAADQATRVPPPRPPEATATPGAPEFACTLVLGVAVTAEWFGAGFERVVDDTRWEAITRPHTTLADWADASNPVWSQPPVSACAARAGDPDRVVFTGMNWDYVRAEQWVASLAAVVEVIKLKFPHVRRVDLLTMVRAPRNRSCGNPMSVVAPFVDQAILTVTGRYPDLVHAGPRFEVVNCDLFKKGGPHFTDEGSAAVARMIAAHFGRDARDKPAKIR